MSHLQTASASHSMATVILCSIFFIHFIDVCQSSIFRNAFYWYDTTKVYLKAFCSDKKCLSCPLRYIVYVSCLEVELFLLQCEYNSQTCY